MEIRKLSQQGFCELVLSHATFSGKNIQFSFDCRAGDRGRKNWYFSVSQDRFKDATYGGDERFVPMC